MSFNFNQKAYEICYAVFRLGSGIKNIELRNRLEKTGLDLLEFSSAENHSLTGRALSVLETLVNFGQGVGEISYPHSQVLLREIGNFNSAIKQANSATKEINLEEFFSKPEIPVVPMVVSSVEQDEPLNTGENAAMRKSAIIGIMRQVQDCRIKDLVAAFPGTSERTLRYDLQKLCEEGMIERVGSGGPGTYYQLKSGLPTGRQA